MTDPSPSIEIIAPTVEDAVARGAAELGVSPESLVVEILDEGGRGVLGLAARQARVRLTVLGEIDRRREAAPAPAEPEAMSEAEEEALDVSQAIVAELLERMGIDAQVTGRWAPETEPDGSRPLLLDVRGRDLSVLIGRKGESLAALQYITRLIVAKELDRLVPLVIDVEGYRARRERQLRQLARRMAGQAVETERTMTLEPMPANERRIVHIELREHAEVYTESVGEGDQRKVTIIPRRSEDP